MTRVKDNRRHCAIDEITPLATTFETLAAGPQSLIVGALVPPNRR
jgi:hypothetical protein